MLARIRKVRLFIVLSLGVLTLTFFQNCSPLGSSKLSSVAPEQVAPGTDTGANVPDTPANLKDAILDAYPGATFAVSLRALTLNYKGALIKVRRQSDGTTKDIGYTASGDLDTSAASAFCTSTTCYLQTWYDQSGNGNHLVQNTAAKQFPLVLNDPSGKPVLHACATCGMKAPDAPVYKTPIVNAFVTTRMGLANYGAGFQGGWIVGYPRTANSDVTDAAWALSNFNQAIQLQVWANGGYLHNTSNPEGLGAVFRRQLFQYEINTNTQASYVNRTPFADSGFTSTVNYPNAVGLTVGMDGKGTSNLQNGDLSEIILYGTGQAKHHEISAAQAAYWKVVDPPASVMTTDGFKWSPYYYSDWGSSGGPNAGVFARDLRNLPYFTEGPFDSYSLWRATNVVNNMPLYRFEVREGDVDNLTDSERSELDGGQNLSPVDSTTQISYAVLVEPGQPITNASWNVLGQFHYENAAYPPCSFSISLINDTWSVDKDGAPNPVTAYTAPSKITRNTWYNFFIEQKISSSGTADVLKIWINGTQVVNLSGNLFPNGKQAGYMKFGIYRGYTVAPDEAVRYANMEVVNKAMTDISSRINSPLPVPTHQ